MTRLKSTMVAGAVCAAAVATATPGAALTGVATSGYPTRSAQAREASIAAANKELTTAKTELREAKAEAEGLRKLAAQPKPSTTDGTLETVAELLGTADPVEALDGADAPVVDGTAFERASATSSTPTTSDGATVQPAGVATAADVSEAEERVRSAEQRLVEARVMVSQFESSSRPADGPGARQLARLCSDAGVLVRECEDPGWTEGHLRFDTVMIGRHVNVQWPEVRRVGGWRPSDPYPDHPSGRAADIMMPNGGKGSDVELGNDIARYFQEHAKEFGIYYMIWRQRIWTVGSKPGKWRGMSDRGSPTANHMDHVHITVKNGHSSTVWKRLLREAPGATTA